MAFLLSSLNLYLFLTSGKKLFYHLHGVTVIRKRKRDFKKVPSISFTKGALECSGQYHSPLSALNYTVYHCPCLYWWMMTYCCWPQRSPSLCLPVYFGLLSVSTLQWDIVFHLNPSWHILKASGVC